MYQRVSSHDAGKDGSCQNESYFHFPIDFLEVGDGLLE